MSIKIETRTCEGPNNQTRLEVPVEIGVNTAMHQIKCPFLAIHQIAPSEAIVELCTAPDEVSNLPKATNPLNLPHCRFSISASIQSTGPRREYGLEPVLNKPPQVTVTPQYP